MAPGSRRFQGSQGSARAKSETNRAVSRTGGEVRGSRATRSASAWRRSWQAQVAHRPEASGGGRAGVMPRAGEVERVDRRMARAPVAGAAEIAVDQDAAAARIDPRQVLGPRGRRQRAGEAPASTARGRSLEAGKNRLRSASIRPSRWIGRTIRQPCHCAKQDLAAEPTGASRQAIWNECYGMEFFGVLCGGAPIRY